MMFKRTVLILFTLIGALHLYAHNVPTTYEDAKAIGDAKLSALLETNQPAVVHYVVLRSGCRLNKLIKRDNTIYVIDKKYSLKGKTLTMPHNSVLVIRRGNIKNGYLFGINSKYCTFDDKRI